MRKKLKFPIKYNGRYIFIDSEDRLRKSISFDYIKQSSFSDGYCVFINVSKNKETRRWKDGYIDTDGKIINMIGYNELHPFSEGMSRVRRGEYYGFVNLGIKEYIECKYLDAMCFSEGLACVSNGENYGYINSRGEVELDFEYVTAGKFVDGKAIVSSDDDVFVIDKLGNRLFGLGYDVYSAGYFQDEMLRIWDGCFRYSYLNESGEQIMSFSMKRANDFSEGYASIKIEEKWGFINKEAEIVINPKYEYAGCFKNGLCMVAKKNIDGSNSWGYINKAGDEVIPLIYDSCENFTVDYAQVAIQGEFYYINRNGEKIF